MPSPRCPASTLRCTAGPSRKRAYEAEEEEEEMDDEVKKRLAALRG